MEQNKSKIQDINRELDSFKKQLQLQREHRNDLYNDYTNSNVVYDAPSFDEYDSNNLVSNLKNPNYQKPSSQHWYNNVWDSAVKTVSSIGSDFANSARMWTGKLIDLFINEDYANIRNVSEEQDDLQKITEYKNLHAKLAELKSDRAYDLNEGVKEAMIKDIESKIAEYDNYFMGEGRSHTVIAQQMFDINKMDAIDKAFVNASYMTKNLDRNDYRDGSIKGYIDQVGKNILNVFSAVEGVVDWVATTGALGLDNLVGNGNKVNGYKTGEVIKRLDYNNEVDRNFLNKLYKGSRENALNIWQSIDSDKINQWKEYNNRRINEFVADLESDKQFAKDGKLFGVDIYDPQDVPQQFKDAQQLFGKNWYDAFIHPYDALLYGIPETASTVGMMGSQIKAMGVNGLLGYISRKAPVWAISGSNILARGAGKFALTSFGKSAMEATGVASGIDAAKESRRKETALEALDAVVERVSKEALGYSLDGIVHFPADMEKVKNAVLSAADDMDIDTSKFSEEDIIKFAVTYNVNTGDPVFENAKTKARRGLNKLINANNALAVVDYLLALYFMPYSGKAMKNWATSLFNNGKYIPQQALLENNKTIFLAVNDATIGKIVDKFIKKDAVKKGLYLKHAGEWALRAGTVGLGEKLSEGVEEVNQSLLQQKYLRGLYDNYNREPNMLDVNEVFSNVNLSFEGLAAYCGIKPWDPYLNTEEIRKSFFGGVAGASLFSLIAGGVSNTFYQDDESFRNLIRLLKNDKVLSNIVANYYDQVLDLKHLELFFDAFTKAGIDRVHLQKSLSDLRNSVDEQNTLVKKDFVDSDIQLMNAAWSVFDNKNVNEALKANGIEKYGDLHKQIVIDGAAAIVEDLKNLEQIREGDRKIKRIQQDHNNIVEEMLNDDISPERLKELESKYPSLANIVLQLKQDYEEYKADRESSLKGKLGAFSRKFDSVKKFSEHEGVKDYIIKHGLSEETVSQEDSEGYDPLEAEAKRIFINNKERKAAIKHAFEYENRKNYGNLLLEKRDFKRNKYIRQYVRGLVQNEDLLLDKLDEIYDDKQKRELAITKAFESFNNGTYSRNDYIIERIHLLHNYMKLQRLLYARDVAADKNRRNAEMRKKTGLDTYTGLEGIVDALDKEIERYRKIEDQQLNKKGTPEDQKLHWADFFKDKKFEFDDQLEFDLEFSTLALNSAINGPQRILAAAYLMGYSNPMSLSDAMFGTLSENNVLSDIKKQYKDILAEESLDLDLDSEATRLSDTTSRAHDKKELSKKAAWTIIKKRLDENIKRRRIANRLFEEEGPITPATEEALRNDAENKEDEQLDAQQEEQKQPTKEAPMSDAEKRLNQKYNHEKGDQKTLDEKVKERRERRRKAVVEDSFEEPEEETPEVTDEEEPVVDEGQSEETQGSSKEELPKEERPADSQPEQDNPKSEDEPEMLPDETPDYDQPQDYSNDDDFDINNGEEDDEDVEFIPEDIDRNDEQSIRDAEAATAEFEEEAETNATILEGGWILIEDYSGLEFNDEGYLMYNGEILPDDQQQDVMDDLILLGLSENAGFSQEQLPDGSKRNIKDIRQVGSNDQVADLISQTFFYQPNPKVNEETGEEELPILTVDGKQVKFDKPIASGKELSKKLSQRGWLGKTKKYFVVTQSQQGKNVANYKDVRDAMTVALVIEDDTNTYLTFLRSLGLTESEGYGPHGSIMVDSEKARRNWLLSRHVDWMQVIAVVDKSQYSYSDGQIYKKSSKYPLTSSQKVALYQQAVTKIAMDRAKQGYYANTGTYDGFERWYTNDPIRSDFKDDETWQKAVAERKRMRKLYTDRARQSLASAGKTMLSEEQVDKQINDLRAFRNRIIDAYLTKTEKNGIVSYKFPKTIKKTVTPVQVMQSNGKINNQKDRYKNPIYRTIGNQDATIEDIQKDLETGEITLGYGLGMFANENDRFAIRGLLDSDATVQFHGKGLSGKIYWMVKGPAGSELRIPVMLAEEKFDELVQNIDGRQRTVYLNNPDNLVLCLRKNPLTGEFENVNTEGYQPSAAEIIFYMLINQMNVGLDAGRHREVVEFFIHNDEKTLLKNQPKSGTDPFNVLGSKQLAFHTVDDEQVLTIGIKDEDGKYEARSFTVEEMMMQTEEGEALRRQIVNAIATQMHWNTDLAHMNSSINVLGTSNSSVSQLFRWAIDNFAEDIEDTEAYLNQRVSIFGCPQLSFRIGDFFTKEGDDIKSKENVSILAWMIKELKIKTDAGEQVFTAPFVFANGVKVDGQQIEQQSDALAVAAGEDLESPTINITNPPKAPKKPKVSKNPKQEPITVNFDLSDESVYNEMVSEWRPGLEDRRKREGWFVAKTEDEREKVRESINQTKDAKDNGGINDRIMIRAPKEKISQDKAIEEFKKTLKSFLDKYNEKYPDKAVAADKVSINSLTEDLIKTQWALKRGYILLDLYKNGNAKVQVRRDADFSNWQNPVTGVFSKTIGGSGTFNINKARKWLSDTLGIDASNIVLTNAVMKSTTDEDVYGLTNVALDRIAGEVTGYMKFSEYADSGIEYHEAWHYVNLLMHDKNTRMRIYQAYLKTHKNLNKPGVKLSDVEEAMADDFKVFMEGFVDKSIFGSVRRLFSNILDFLISSRNKRAYKSVFRSIAEGKYAAVKLDSESVKEFQTKYKNGVASVSHSVSGISKKQLDKMTHVRTYQDIFDGTNAIINRVFSVLDLTSPKKMQAIANNGFGKVLLIVDDMIGEQTDENKVLKLQDIRQNELFLRKALIDAFAELGIIAKVRKATDIQKTERNEINEDALKKEDDPDNTWDKFILTSQRKENASLSTKMFLRLIPVYAKHYLDDGTPQYDLERDDYGTIKMYDSDQAWRKIIDTLWMCDSYAELDENGKYSPTSIMGIVESHKNVEPFFYSLYMKLQDLDLQGEYGDTQLKSLILSTVNSSKNQVLLITIQNPREAKVSIEDEYFMSDEEQSTFDDNGAVADKKREWILRNDSLISVARNLPRKWSKNLASNGLLGFNNKKGESVVDRNFVERIEKDLNSIQKNIQKYTSTKKTGFVPKTDSELQAALDKIKPKVIEFYTSLGIESDMPSLNVYIALMSGINGELTPLQLIDTLNRIFNTSTVGSISYIVDGLVTNIGNSEVTPSGSKYERSIDEAFSEYAADSHIGTLALAWSAIHPSSQEFSVKDANDNRLYPINLNNYISDRIRSMNNRRSNYIKNMQKSQYCKHSIIADASKQVDASNPKSKIKLNTFVGIRDANNAVGADYFGITAAEDYIAKLCMTEDDLIIFPTMADKKMWNSLSSENIKLTHDAMLIGPLNRDLNKHIYEAYEEIVPYDKTKYTSIYAWRSEAEKWYRNLDNNDELKVNIIKNASFDLGSKRVAGVGFDLDVDEGLVTARFSDTTLNRFAGYFLDELNALIDYYDKDAVKRAVKNKNSRIENYHGKINDGRMDFSGNGGKFRYLYDIPFPGMKHNLNHMLEGLFELQKMIESGKAADRSKQEGDLYKYIGTGVLNSDNLDGFELIREYLKDLKSTYFKRGGMAKPELLNAINRKLVDQTESELYRISRPGSPLQLAEFNKKTGVYVPKGIPEQLLNRYTEILQEANYGSYGKAYDSEDLLHHALFSLIGSHVANTATSIIEVEKIFSGDPAFYKKKAQSKIVRVENYSKLPKTGSRGAIYVTEDTLKAYEYKSGRYTQINPDNNPAIERVDIQMNFDSGEYASEQIIVENLDDVFSDKIKRLGGTLSPGLELRLDFTDEELEFDPTLKCTKYTNLNVEDINIPSLFLDEIEKLFKRQLVVDMIRSNQPKGFTDFLTDLQNDRKKTNERLKKENKKLQDEVTVENAIDRIYSSDKAFEQMWQNLTDKERSSIESMLAQQMRPYKDITVADALVFIRPALYRKIRISLGQWSFEPDETGYSDEEAYNILEGITVNSDGTRTKAENPSDEWSRDLKLYEKVRKLQLFPLKMSYFQNDTEQVTDKISINRPIYNKMAIFPLFAFQRSTSVGDALYKRMNQAGNELDMISFKSAVKVGAVQKGVNVTGSDDVKEAMNKLNDNLNNPSNVHLDYTTGETVPNTSKSTLGVTVQDLSNLRMQLNTQAHDAELRSIGTQMFKIAFSNIIDDAMYGTRKAGRSARKGSAVKRDIISCINALTRIGVEDIKERFYKNGSIDDEAVRLFIETVVKNNGLGSSAEEIISNGGTAAGLISRTVFENSSSSIVNSDIIDINTKGGTAIQLSVFGFTGYGSSNVGTLNYNDGKELKWSAEEGSMQVMLSMNFFKAVIPDYKNKTHKQRRDWLVLHNIIGDKAKPFGVGYRIPTQGMSSMFAFQVADVLPELVGDLIIVPREFTAQTGSDFDVDKLYLATFSYKDGVLESLSNLAFGNRKRSFEESMDIAEDRQLASGVDTEEIDVTKWLQDAQDIEIEDFRGAIANRLLLNYIDIISDIRNYADARGSIDVITNKLHDELLDPILKTKSKGYITGMAELLPSFQALRKMEFGVGKSGIGPFALNITNLALTQYAHLTIDFGNVGEEYGFGKLDKIYGKDDQRISAWLSAMVNAHVDVAKDPYVFDLNVNQATYNHANLLLRAGMGISTFTFLAQPALKDYADALNNAGGLYGDNIEGDTPMAEANRSRKKAIFNSKINYYREQLNSLLESYKDSIDNVTYAKATRTVEYYDWLTMPNSIRKENGYDNEHKPESTRDRKTMFSGDEGKQALTQYKPNSEVTAENVTSVVNSLIFQLHALESFKEIDEFALQLSQLVLCSLIDTKKFGNTIHQQIDFVNKYDAFRLNSNMFTINDPSFLDSLTPKNEEKGLTKKEISTAALNRYFNSLYLNLKLRNAVRFTKDIISKEVFSATDAYESLFKNILGIINGYDTREEIDGTLNVGYKPVYNKKSIDSFAQGIDNMMRFNSFMNLGYQIYKNEVSRNDETLMIDFTMGGNINAVVNKFKELTFGSEKLKSIFVRLAKLINNIKKDPYSEKADGLVNGDGEITNDLLLYLNPQTPNDKYPIGRMLLLNLQTENKSSEERRLISAFAQLLEHPDEEVRLLANDLAFYAYFSTYDQNTANSFFHLVPAEHRKQYDLALRNSLQALSSKKPEIKTKAVRNAGGVNLAVDLSERDVEVVSASNMIDVLSRNYWYDDNIVPVHYTTTQPPESRFQSSGLNGDIEEFTGVLIYDAESGRMFPTYIASTRVRNDSMYIKIRKGSGTFLYKRVGTVNRYYTDKKGNLKSATPYQIYIAIPKAGLHTKGITQFELYANYTTPSIFEENKLDKEYAEDLVRKDVEESVKEDSDGYYKLELSWDNDAIPEMYMSSNVNTYIDDTPAEPDKRRINGVTVYNKKDPEWIGQKTADVIIDFVNNKTTGDVDRPNVKKDYKDKVVELALDGDIKSVAKAIQKIKDKDIKIHLTTPIYDGLFDVSDLEFEAYIKNELEQYKGRLGNDVQDVESLIKAKEETLRSNKWTRRNISQEKINNILHDLTQQLILSGVTITRYSSAAKDGKTLLSLGVSYVKSVDGQYLDSDKNTVFVDRELSSKKKKFNSLLARLDYTPKNLQSEQNEETATILIPKEETDGDTTKVEQIIEKELKATPTRSKFTQGAVKDMEELGKQVGEDDTPAILKEAEQKEQKKEESNNQKCGGGRRSRSAGAVTDALEE